MTGEWIAPARSELLMTHTRAALESYEARAAAAATEEDRRYHGRGAADLLYGEVVRGERPGYSEFTDGELRRVVANAGGGPEPFEREVVAACAFAHLFYLRRLFMQRYPWLQIEIRVREVPGAPSQADAAVERAAAELGKEQP